MDQTHAAIALDRRADREMSTEVFERMGQMRGNVSFTHRDGLFGQMGLDVLQSDHEYSITHGSSPDGWLMEPVKQTLPPGAFCFTASNTFTGTGVFPEHLGDGMRCGMDEYLLIG